MPSLNPRYTFSSFVLGPSNEIAAASASAVAAAPGVTYNPLFIHGQTGLGKTHLMQAVAHEISRQRPSLSVIYQPADTFREECVQAIAEGTLSSFHGRYAAADLLLLDDVHALVGRPDAQAEFATVFRLLTASRRQVMLTSDRGPQSTGIDDTLVNAFQLGRVASLGIPAWEHRLAILQAKLVADAQEELVPAAVLELIATAFTANVRQLEGALTRLVAYAQLKRVPVSVGLAREALHLDREATTARSPAAHVTMISEMVAREWRTTTDALVGPQRTKVIAEARQVAMYLVRKLIGLSFAQIGEHFGGRDHTTVLYAAQRVEATLDAEQVFASRVLQLERRLMVLLGESSPVA
jgi:chromosomal replication initiator protein